MEAGEQEETRKLKELLYRVEAERLQLQQQAAGLAENKQQLKADVLKLQKQLADAHAAFADSQQQVSALTATCDQLAIQVQAATSEYRANDIIAVGLRDHITRLQHELQACQHACAQQAAKISSFAGDMASLRNSKSELTQQLSELQQQHQQLQDQHASTAQQLTRAQQDLQDTQQRWVCEHGDQARQLQGLQEARQQALDRMEELTNQLQQEQQQLAQQRDRCAELEGELTRIRELVVLLGKAMGKLPGGQQLPGHDDPVWLKLGPLGGVAFALDTVIKYTRDQRVLVKELQAEHDQLEDRVRAESAQKADLQSELYEARTLYAKAIAVRDALEARTTRAEAEKAAAEGSLQQARTQATDDSSQISSLQEQVLSLAQQVQVLQPLQPKLSTAVVERDTALHRLERLQEKHDELQRQLQHATAREGGLQDEVDAYKLEHQQLLASNAQLVAQCAGFTKELQALEMTVREGSLAKEQLVEAQRQLNRTKTQLQAMTDRHMDTLHRLETTKDLLTLFPGGEAAGGGSRPASAWGRGGRPGTAAKLAGLPGGGSGSSSSPRPNPRGSSVGAQQQQQQSAAGGNNSSAIGSHRSTGDSLTVAAGAAVAAAAGSAAGPAAAAGGVVADADQAPGPDGDSLQRSASRELETMLRQRELERLAADQQEELEELQQHLQQQQEQVAQLEVRLLQQEAQHLQQLQARQAAVSEQCLGAAADAVAALQAALGELQQALDGPPSSADEPSAPAAAAAVASSCLSEGVSDLVASSSSSSGSLASNAEQPSSQQPLQQQQQQQQQQQPQRKRWLSRIAGEMLANMQAMVDEAQARARLVAARQDVGVQSDDTQHTQWLAFLRGLPDACVAQPLALKAAGEAILRIYMRGLQQLEATTQALQQQQQRQPRGQGLVLGQAGVVGVSGVALTVFDLLIAHYSSPAAVQQPQRGRLAVQPYNASLWRDPQGPITRLLVSCRGLSASSVKVALFCCLAGTTAAGPSGATWGAAHWQQFLLLLHAAKQLTGGLWKGLLREWAGAGGAQLPLQCVLDLLGNVYNASSLLALDQQPALLGSKLALLQATQQQHQQGQGQPSQLQQQQQVDSVSGALRELLVDGPLGPASAVDFDELLAMLMLQFDAGLLPSHPLLQPRRLTTGDLANTTNAWGTAATEAAAGLPPRRPTLLSAVPGNLAAEGSDTGRSDWGFLQPNSPSGVSTLGGWLSRPTTGAATSRIGTAATDRSTQPAASSNLTLPRIRAAADGDTGDGRRTSSSTGAAPGSLPTPLLSPAATKHPPSIKKGVSMARVAFRDPDGLPRDK